MPSLPFGKRREVCGIHAADGIGKFGCKKRNPVALRNNVPARRALPIERPNRITVGNGLDRSASKTPTSFGGHTVHMQQPIWQHRQAR